MWRGGVSAFTRRCRSARRCARSRASRRTQIEHFLANDFCVQKKRRVLKAPIEITDAAAGRIKDLIGDRDIYGIRVGVRTRGCNGLSYTLNYADKKEKFEDEVKEKGVTVLIEPKAVMHIVGSTMDFVEDELVSEFVFHNPNAKDYCGCGESFTTG